MEYNAVDLDLERHRFEKRRRRERAQHHARRILEVAREGDVLPVRRALMAIAVDVIAIGDDAALTRAERRRRTKEIKRMRRTAVAIALQQRSDAAAGTKRFTSQEVDQVATKQQELRARIRKYAEEIDREKPDIAATEALNLVRVRYGAEAQKLGVSLEYMNFLTTHWHKLRPPKSRKARRTAPQKVAAAPAKPASKAERGGTPAAAARTTAAAADKPERAVAAVPRPRAAGLSRVYRGAINVEVQVLGAGAVRVIYDIPEQLAQLLPGLNLIGATR